MALPHRWDDCAGEWHPKRGGGRVYWACMSCGYRFIHDEDVMRAAMRENKLGRTLRFLTETGSRLLRRKRDS